MFPFLQYFTNFCDPVFGKLSCTLAAAVFLIHSCPPVMLKYNLPSLLSLVSSGRSFHPDHGPFVVNTLSLFLLFYDRNCHHGLKWCTAVEQNRFSVHTNTIIHGRFLPWLILWSPFSPPFAISTNKHFPPALYKIDQENTQLSLKTGTDFY